MREMQDLNPMKAMNDIQTATARTKEMFHEITASGDSLEASNRDSCKVLATKYNEICQERNKLGKFVFMSAEASIIGDASP